MKISIIAPMFNEAENIHTTLDKIKAELLKNNIEDYEIIFVNDGSTDDTWERAQILAKSDNKLILTGYDQNIGRGKALRTGIDLATGDIIVTVDFDLTYDASHITKMIKELEKNQMIDAVLVSIHMPGSKTIGIPKKRLLVSRLGNYIYRFAFPVKIYTSTCVVRAYRKDVIKSLDLESDDKEIHLEILSKLMANGYRIKEIPGTQTYRSKGKSKFRFKATSLSHLLFFIQVRPFIIFGFLGLFMMFLGILASLGFLYIRYIDKEFVHTLIGSTLSTNLVIILFISGIQILIFGFLGAQISHLKKELFRTQRLIKQKDNVR